jgi:hypothetical protein
MNTKMIGRINKKKKTFKKLVLYYKNIEEIGLILQINQEIAVILRKHGVFESKFLIRDLYNIIQRSKFIIIHKKQIYKMFASVD